MTPFTTDSLLSGHDRSDRPRHCVVQASAQHASAHRVCNHAPLESSSEGCVLTFLPRSWAYFQAPSTDSTEPFRVLNRHREHTLPRPLRLPLPPAPRMFNTPVSVGATAGEEAALDDPGSAGAGEGYDGRVDLRDTETSSAAEPCGVKVREHERQLGQRWRVKI